MASLMALARPLRLGAGIAISLLMVWLLLRDVDLGEVGDTLGQADIRYLVPIALVFFARYWARAVRWQILVRHLKAVATRRALPRVILGQAANLTLPFGLGYVLLVQITAKKFHIGRRELFGAEAIERMMDGFVFALLLALALATITIGDGFTGLTAFMLLGAPAGLALAWLATRPRERSEERAGLRGFPARTLARPQIQPFLCGLRAIQNPAQTTQVLLLTLAVWLGEALLYWAVAASLGIHVSFLVHIFVVAAANIGAGIPLAQASVGLAFLAKEALVATGESADTAIAYAVGVEAIIILPSIVLAPLAAYDLRLGWRDVIPRFERAGAEPAIAATGPG